VDVREKGARGDGTGDDTAAFQAAIDALPPGGGTVRVPPGNYPIDATRSVRLRSDVHLALAPDAVLVALPNDRERHYVVHVENVSNVRITGGRIVGERERHLGTTGEWGFGIYIRGAENVTVSGTHISKCWGDGICVGSLFVQKKLVRLSSDITLSNVTCTGNRRQGLSLGPCRNVRVLDSEFSHTAGIKPGCGIDIEPERLEPAQDVLIERCTLVGNQGSGVQVYENVRGATLKDCRIERNTGYGVLVVGAERVAIEKNVVAENGMTGVYVRTGSRTCQVRANTFRNNATARLKRLLELRRRGSRKAITREGWDLSIADDTVGATVADNTFAK
jgi:parallel beta-helix repeat protein